MNGRKKVNTVIRLLDEATGMCTLLHRYDDGSEGTWRSKLSIAQVPPFLRQIGAKESEIERVMRELESDGRSLAFTEPDPRGA